MHFTPGDITALVIAASFAAGLNIYATVLTLGILARTQWVALPVGLDSLGHTWVIVVCAVMFGIEIFADKVPGFDIAWNMLHTLVRVPVAALVAYHASAQLSPQMQIFATGLGAAIALAAHSSKTALRAVVTPSPEPISNIALSSSEDLAAIGLTWFATHHPMVAATIAVALLVAAVLVVRALVRAVHRPLRKLFRIPEKQPAVEKVPRSE